MNGAVFGKGASALAKIRYLYGLAAALLSSTSERRKSFAPSLPGGGSPGEPHALGNHVGTLFPPQPHFMLTFDLPPGIINGLARVVAPSATGEDVCFHDMA